MKEVRAALTIAGSDPSGGAGIQADLKTFAALGVYGTSAITAITAQNTTGISDMLALQADLVSAQIEAIASDITLHATKTGMLANAAIVEAVAAAIKELDLPNVVVDPVMISKTGVRLLDDDGTLMLRTELLTQARVVTPNIPEAEVLSGRRIESIEDARAAAYTIHGASGSAVLITGGHAEGDEIVDLLFEDGLFSELHSHRIDSRSTHGTGCTFASAVAAQLALGHSLIDAIANAQSYVASAIEHALSIGHGHGPLNHFWRL